MKIALLSDIHANSPALAAVKQHAAGQGVTRYWFLGDAVGYGPDPAPCVEFLRDCVTDWAWVIGNHDAYYAGLLAPGELANMREHAKDGIERNRAALAAHPKVERWLLKNFRKPRRRGPIRRTFDGVCYTLLHTPLGDPVTGGYIYPWNEYLLKRIFEEMQEATGAVEQGPRQKRIPPPACKIFGHSHIQLLATQHDARPGACDNHRIRYGHAYPLGRGRTLINPGSVGQPRDEDRRAAYAVLDTTRHRVTFYRVAYEWETVRDALSDQGYHSQIQKMHREAPLPDDIKDFKKWLPGEHADLALIPGYPRFVSASVSGREA